ncbi:uncharacterized protein LOC134436011 [Engraulis encrasicolus]|uniref:uncharacterized protein LOC134436011 n=1 Tax=Engraulis encrasicolus TaxID=184585 RepID=UPI002FD3E655
MADEGAGSWNSGGGRQWGSGDYTGQQEGDFVRDRHRRDEWSDISDDEGPVVYADISRAGEYNYHVVQPQVQPVAGSGNERASRTDETPAGFSGFPWQQSVGWRHHQNVFPPYPSVPSGSMEYLPPSYPPGSGLRNMDYLPQSYMNLPLAYPPDSRLRSMDYLPQSYPPSLYHVAQRPDMSYLHHGGPMGEGKKRTNTSVAVTARNMAMDRRKDLSKSVGYQGSHLEGAPTSYPPALYQVAQKTETSFLHHGVIREGEKMKSNSVPRAERGIPVEKKEDVSKNAFFQGTYHERMPTSYPPALYPVAQKTDTPFLHGGLIREREKLKSNNVPKQDISQRKEDLSKNVGYQGSHLERTPTSYTPELYQVAKKTDTHFLHQGVIREGDKRKCNSVPIAEQSIPGEKKLKDLCSNNAIYQGSHLEVRAKLFW